MRKHVVKPNTAKGRAECIIWTSQGAGVSQMSSMTSSTCRRGCIVNSKKLLKLRRTLMQNTPMQGNVSAH
eukprot:961495-Alexandrium_andersonii.AAC.1